MKLILWIKGLASAVLDRELSNKQPYLPFRAVLPFQTLIFLSLYSNKSLVEIELPKHSALAVYFPNVTGSNTYDLHLIIS